MSKLYWNIELYLGVVLLIHAYFGGETNTLGAGVVLMIIVALGGINEKRYQRKNKLREKEEG